MFPEKTKYLKRKIGWKNLGKIEEFDYYNPTSDCNHTKTEVCTLCNSRVHIGKEKSGELFKFCPRCLRKIKILSE